MDSHLDAIRRICYQHHNTHLLSRHARAGNGGLLASRSRHAGNYLSSRSPEEHGILDIWGDGTIGLVHRYPHC